MLLYITAFIASLIGSVYLYGKWAYKYWKRLGVPYVEPQFPFGNFKDVIRQEKSLGELAKKHYHIAKSKGYKHIGVYGLLRPQYVPVHPEILKSMLIKDFNHFCDRGFYHNKKDDPISGNLFFLDGDNWRNIRAKLSPTFTSGKIKQMFNIVLDCCKQMKETMDVKSESGPIDIKHYLSCLGIDVIGSCAFGLNCNSFENFNNDFYKFSKRVFEPTDRENIKGAFTLCFPAITKFFRMKVMSADVSQFFLNITRNVVNYRKTNNVVRNDLMQILINLMEGDSGLTMDEVSAQAFIFFVAGFETSATVLMYCLVELAQHQDIQEKLRQEVHEVMNRNKQELTYDNTKEMVYMQQVLDETLRKYPPLSVLNRVCTADYKIPTTNIVLKKGTSVVISLLGIQNDPDYFPDPEKFDPDRFSSENKEKINPLSYMPFGEGPRFCIGLRLGNLQMKITMSMLLKHYKFSMNPRTQLPLKVNPKNFIHCPQESVWMNVEKIHS